MKAVVTGAAGFIGSHLVDALLDRGDQVVGVDAFTDYYDTEAKRANLAIAADNAGFTLHTADLVETDLAGLLASVDVVFHLAGQPGVRVSWAGGFDTYDRHNILATQRLLEACRRTDIRRFVFASSSSIYGNARRFPCGEDDLPRPFSPYGVTKLAAEHLCRAYADNFGVPTVSLRYFTVYGPRQRPDMAFHRLIEAGLTGASFPLFGGGHQVRDFTYVSDAVAANVAAGDAEVVPGAVYNIAGGGSERLSDVIDLAGELIGEPVRVDRHGAQDGDVARTGGSVERAQRDLGWSPAVELPQGLAEQISWHRARR